MVVSPCTSATTNVGREVLEVFRAYEESKGTALSASDLKKILKQLLQTGDTQIQRMLEASCCLQQGATDDSGPIVIEKFISWLFPEAQVQASGPQVVFVLGGPGCGKGTFCTRIVEHFGYSHLSAGDLLRAERARPNSKVGALIEARIKEGKIVPSEITVGLLEQEMRRQGWEGGKYLVDGFPRNAENADAWDRLLGGKVCLKFCFFIECSEACMERRLLHRGQTSGRSDDNIETIRKRFVTFQEESLPVIQKLERSGLVRTVNSEPGIENVWHEVEAIFGGS